MYMVISDSSKYGDKCPTNAWGLQSAGLAGVLTLCNKQK